MTDIMKTIRSETQKDPVIQDHLVDMEDWSEDAARQIAQREQISLTPAHWEVIHFLREHYREHGGVSGARKLTEVLDARFASQGGKRYLYTLFPGGPVGQGGRIAGLPPLHDTREPSFGSVQ